MNDDSRDPELQTLREHWVPPGPSDSLDGRVLSAFRHDVRSRRRVRRFWIPVLATVLVIAAGRIATVRTTPPAPVFVPVRQPQLIIVSRGEHP
jgi:hypothetical protein